MKPMGGLALLFFLAAGAVLAAGTDWFGQAPASDGPSIAVAEVLASAEVHENQTIRVSGRITDVCSKRGCWAVLADGGAALRVMVRDHAFALPDDLRGPAEAHGVLLKVELNDDQVRHLVEVDGADPDLFAEPWEYRLVIDGLRPLG